jgi:enolase
MYKITDLKARYIYDSRGVPTVEAEIVLNNSSFANFSVASGASKGSREALELRDNKKDFNGQGVNQAISNILTIIKPQIINKVFNTQEELDLALIKLDGTKNKSNLGANAILSVSGAFFKASYKFLRI